MQTLQFLINELTRGRNFHISILDLTGILDTPTAKIDIKNVVHSKNYCDIAKSTPKGYETCLHCKMLANTKAIKEKEPFGGHCVYGLYEISVPVIADGNVAAIVYVGHTVVDKKKTTDIITRTCKKTAVEEKKLLHELKNCEHLDSAEELFGIGELIADYIIWLDKHTPKPNHELHWLVYLMKRHAEEMYKTDISLSEHAKTYQKNEKYIGRLFKKEMGMTYAEYKINCRLKFAESMIVQGDDRIIDIAYECGFNSISYFNRAFQKKFGMSPTEYRIRKKDAHHHS
jgi:two-component system response regulator YesN